MDKQDNDKGALFGVGLSTPPTAPTAGLRCGAGVLACLTRSRPEARTTI
jgi:hypothetical protein